MATITIHSMSSESKWAIDPVWGENPPVDTVVKLWVTASNRFIPATR